VQSFAVLFHLFELDSSPFEAKKPAAKEETKLRELSSFSAFQLHGMALRSRPLGPEGGFMKKISVLTLLTLVAWIWIPVFVGGHVPANLGPAYAQAKIKVVVLGKVSKEQSARRFDPVFPELSRNFEEAFSKDGRFEVISQDVVDKALYDLGIAKDKIKPDDAVQLQRIGKQGGADLVFASYYYEMGGHGMPFHSNNVLILVPVSDQEVVKLDREYSRVLMEKSDLASSDQVGFKELLKKAEPLIQGLQGR
jgi:hypothetical protein